MIEPSKSLSREQKMKQLQGALTFGGVNVLAAGLAVGVAGFTPPNYWFFLVCAFLGGLNLIFIASMQLTDQNELWEGYIKGFINTLKYFFSALLWGFFSFVLVMMSLWMGSTVYGRPLNNTGDVMNIMFAITILVGVVYLIYKAIQDGRAWWAEHEMEFEEETVLICPNCQNENPSTKKQCYVCGTPLP